MGIQNNLARSLLIGGGGLFLGGLVQVVIILSTSMNPNLAGIPMVMVISGLGFVLIGVALEWRQRHS